MIALLLQEYVDYLPYKHFNSSTVKSKKNCLKHLMKFLIEDKLETIEFGTFRKFYKFLMDKRFELSTVRKIIVEAKTFIREMESEGKLPITNALHFRVKAVPQNPINYLNEYQLDKLFKLDLSENNRLDKIKDLFLFQCFTGLAYIDMQKFNTNLHLEYSSRGALIVMQREKTAVQSILPLLPGAMAILQKHDGNLPRITNQKYNKYLKELAKLANINMNFTTHLARRTAATMFARQGVDIKGVATALGHKSTKTTERYYIAIEKEKMFDKFGNML